MTKPRWFRVEATPVDKGRRTARFRVVTLDGALLGYIEWYNSWRCYSFFPQHDTVFEKQCLRDLAAWLERATADHREARRIERNLQKQPGPGV